MLQSWRCNWRATRHRSSPALTAYGRKRPHSGTMDPIKTAKPKPIALPDGSEYASDGGNADLLAELSDEEFGIYAALAHAHCALSMLRGAEIQFPVGKEPPPELTLVHSGLDRFAMQLGLLNEAMRMLGIDPDASIPLPRVTRKRN